MGPLGAREGGWYPDMPFSLKCFVAVDVFGHFVREPQHLDTLAKMPTMIVQTEIDDSADHNVGVQIVEEIRRRGGMQKFSTMLQLSPNQTLQIFYIIEQGWALAYSCRVRSFQGQEKVVFFAI